MKFDYGDEVVFRGIGCCVVGITPIETDDQARILGYPLGTVLYTVEFVDGSDRLVPEAEITTLAT